MAIIVEGFDNSGKSTLAASFGLEVLHPGPRPKTHAEELACMRSQQGDARKPVVLDRVTAISHPCYGNKPFEPYLPFIQELVDTQHCIVIYCRPPLEYIQDFSRHQTKSYDDIKKVRWLQDNAERIVKTYDRLMRRVPHMLYDYTNPDQNVIDHAYLAQFTLGAWRQCKSLMRTTN